jgi:catechol 2,3-dioxygenase-like lactoylglutathione lyase family enzyme
MISKFSFQVFLLLLSFSLNAQDIDYVSITVADLQKFISFYKDVLSFKYNGTYTIQNRDAKMLFGIDDSLLEVAVAQLSLGDEKIELMQFTSSLAIHKIPLDSKSNDLWFQHIAIVVSDMDKAYKKLRDAKVEHVSISPQTLPAYITAATGIKAFYFHDPDGHNLELIYFPEGKGNPKWQLLKGLFLGIDYTAIAVNNTDNSLPFYETIGLKVAGHSENYGTEQEHLNQVFGARLWITGLKGNKGIGVEFLDYIAPPGRRPYPADASPADIVHWHTSIKVNNLDDLYTKSKQSNHKIISDGIVSFSNPTAGVSRAFMVRDYEGHAILIFQ